MKSNKLFHTVMKVKNIIYIISLMFAAMSCSMDGDTMMSDTTKEIENSLNNGEVAVSFSLTDGSVATKSTDATTDQEIKNVTVFLLKNDAVIDVMTSETDNTVYSDCFYVKNEGKKMELIVVANASIGTAYENSASILNATANLDDCTKWARHTIDFSKVANSSYNAAIELSQSYAGIELGQFTVVKGEGAKEGVQVSLTGVELLNRNTKGQVNGAMAGVSLENKTWGFGETNPTCQTSSNSTDILNGHNIFFRTFAYDYSEISDKQLALRLTYSIGGKNYTKIITVQGKSENQLAVEAGCIYQVNVTLNVTTKEVTTNLKWEIKGFAQKNVSIDFN